MRICAVAAGVSTILALATTGAVAMDSPNAPGGRSYEMVTPVDKLGSDKGVGVSVIGADRLVLDATGSIQPGDPALGAAAQYAARLSGTQWALSSLVAAAGDGSFDPGTSATAISDDMTRRVVQGRASLSPADTDTSDDLYVIGPEGTTYASIGSIGGNGLSTTGFAASSSDARHLLFRTDEVLEPADAARTSGAQLYEHVVGVGTRLVALRSDGTLIHPDGAVLGDGEISASGSGSLNPISDDGSTIFFESPDPSTGGLPELYARVDGSSTVHVSAPQRTLPDNGPQYTRFAGATGDGQTVLFTTSRQLIDSDTDLATDLYSYALTSGRLTRISAGPGDDVQDANVYGVAGMSDDGRHIYYVASGIITSGAIRDDTNIYHYYTDTGTTDLVAVLEPQEYTTLLPVGTAFQPQEAAVSADGSTFVFASLRRLTDMDTSGIAEIYRYRTGSGGVACISCNRSGPAPVGPASLNLRSTSLGGSGERPNRPVSDDGSTVLFQTLDAIDSRDTNRESDVYVFEDGSARLVTSGVGAGTSSSIGVSGDGDSLFFITYDQLSWQDVDFSRDLYVARIGGGQPKPPDSPQCRGDACQGTTTPPPAITSPATVSFSGPEGSDDAIPSRSQAVFSVLGISRRERALFARRGRITLRVRVSRDGRLTARARADINGRSRMVASASRIARAEGVTVLTLRLSARARRQLRVRGRLRVSIAVSYARTRGARRAVVMLTSRTRTGR